MVRSNTGGKSMNVNALFRNTLPRKLCGFVVLIIGLAATNLRAETLAEYLLNGVDGSSDTNIDSSASVITVSGISLGYATVGGRQGTDVTANEIDNGDFYTFTLNAGVGYELDLSGGSLTFWDRTTRADTYSYSVFTSVDGFTAPLATFSLSAVDIWSSRTVNLGGSDFDNLASFTVRLVLSDVNNANSRHLYFDEFRLDGGIEQVPEPTAATLLALGLILLALRRTRISSAV
jgi:hypothetical protein